MSMLLNDEQRQWRESAHEFLSARSPVAAQRALRDRGDPLGMDPALWRDVVDMGWTAAVFPEACGGFDFGWKGLASVFEHGGRTLAALPLLSSVVLGGGAVAAAGDAAQQQRWLPGIIAGDVRWAMAVDEQARHDPRSVSTRARRDGEDWVLDGDKSFVIDGVGADQLVVVARTVGEVGAEAGRGLFVVDARAQGVTIIAAPLVDSRNTARVQLHQVRVPADAVLGDPADACGVLELILDRARTCLAAEALGLVREVFERTLTYLRERVQFDVAIGSFQALQHRAARLYCDIELLDSCVAGALEAIDNDSADTAMLASIAKARASRLCEHVLNEAVQMHGGIGVTDEFDLGLFLKRARVIQQALGDDYFHRERYARLRGL